MKFGPKSRNCWFKLKFQYAEFNGGVHFILERPYLANEVNEEQLSLQLYGTRDFEKGSCRQHGLPCCGECVRGLLLCTVLRVFK